MVTSFSETLCELIIKSFSAADLFSLNTVLRIQWIPRRCSRRLPLV